VALLVIILFVVFWIWSIIRGLEVSVLCAILSFAFPPIAQVIYSVYEEKLRAPMFCLLGCTLVFYL